MRRPPAFSRFVIPLVSLLILLFVVACADTGDGESDAVESELDTSELAASESASTTRERKNIDDLTPTELANYKAAIQVLKSRDGQDPSKNATQPSYAYLASLHNQHCVHGNPRFLMWHRAVLYYYEQALQATDPKYADVMVPYWDWTVQDPSGDRYPVAFEDQSSVLWVQKRDEDACGSGQPNTTCPNFTFDYIYHDVLTDTTWSDFGGESSSALETPHNTMHGWIGGYPPGTNFVGDMTLLTTAALDPIFWSFHAFVDQLFDYWQNKNPSVTYGYGNVTQSEFEQQSLMQDPSQAWWTVPGGPNPKTVGDVLRASQLGYSYQETSNEKSPPGAPSAAESSEGLFARLAPGAAAMAAAAEPETVHEFPLEIPAEGFGRAILVFEDVAQPTSFNYTGHVYLHPPSVEYRPGDPDFGRYQVGIYTLLAHPDHAHGGPVFIDASRELSELAMTAAGEEYVVTVACDVFGFTTEPSQAELDAQTAIGDLRLELR